jgi:hypothetical protein
MAAPLGHAKVAQPPRRDEAPVAGAPQRPDRGLLGERVTGIEPAFSAWEADVLPLNYTRRRSGSPRASVGGEPVVDG